MNEIAYENCKINKYEINCTYHPEIEKRIKNEEKEEEDWWLIHLD